MLSAKILSFGKDYIQPLELTAFGEHVDSGQHAVC